MVFKTIQELTELIMGNTQFTFENNTIHNGENEYYFDVMAVLLFSQSQAMFANTSMLFVNNSIPAGGIFVMVHSVVTVMGAKLNFENNKGGDGGAMSFYKHSYIVGVNLRQDFTYLQKN